MCPENRQAGLAGDSAQGELSEKALLFSTFNSQPLYKKFLTGGAAKTAAPQAELLAAYVKIGVAR